MWVIRIFFLCIVFCLDFFVVLFTHLCFSLTLDAFFCFVCVCSLYFFLCVFFCFLSVWYWPCMLNLSIKFDDHNIHCVGDFVFPWHYIQACLLFICSVEMNSIAWHISVHCLRLILQYVLLMFVWYQSALNALIIPEKSMLAMLRTLNIGQNY